MPEKTRRQMLSETLQKNADEVSSWPKWMKGAVSTARLFEVAAPSTPVSAAERARDERR